MNRFYFENNRFLPIFLYIMEKLEGKLNIRFDRDVKPDYNFFGLDEKERINAGYIYLNGKLIGIDGSDSGNIRKAFRAGKWNLVIKMQHLKDNYEKIYKKQCPYKVIPWVYLPSPYFFFNSPSEISKTNKKYDLYFRSQSGFGRKQFIDKFNEHLFGLFNNYGNILMTYERIKMEDYFNDHNRIKTGYSMPGMGKACHREMEYFSFGIPTIMPPYKIMYKNVLISGLHYIESRSDDPKDILDSYNQLVNSKELFDNISFSCFEWYRENCGKDNVTDGLIDILKENEVI